MKQQDIIFTGALHADKLYNNVMVYNDNQYYFKPMDKGRTYYFSIESFNENGISEKTKPIEVKATEIRTMIFLLKQRT